jgi:hypothetical protein
MPPMAADLTPPQLKVPEVGTMPLEDVLGKNDISK